MSQQSVIVFLKKHKGKFYNTTELSEELKVNPSSLTTSLRKIRISFPRLLKIKTELLRGNHERNKYGI